MNAAKRTVSSAVDDIKKIIGVLGVTFSVAIFVEKINSVIEGMDHLKNAAEKTGASVEELSKLKFFSEAAGSNIDSVTGALAKLSKGMADAGNEGKPIAEALKFLNLSAKDGNGNLKDSAQLFGEIAKALDRYADGAGKTAIAQAFFGNSGAEMLPIMKKIGELGVVNAIVTKEQAQAAEDYSVQLKILARDKEHLWNIMVSAIIPTLKMLAEMMIKAKKEAGGLGDQMKGLARDGSIEDWADKCAMAIAVVIDAIKVLPRILDAVSASFAVVANDIKVLALASAVLQPGIGVAYTVATGRSPWADLKEAVSDRNIVLAAAGKKYEDLLNKEVDATQKAMTKQIELRKANARDAGRDMDAGRGTDEKPLNFTMGDAKKAAAEQKLFEGAVKSLEAKLADLGKESELERARFALYGTMLTLADGSTRKLTGSLEKMNDPHKKIIELLASEIDRRKNLLLIQEQSVQMIKSMTEATEKARDIELEYAAANRDQLKDMEFELGIMGKSTREQELLTAARKVDLDVRKQVASLPKDESGELMPGAIAAAERIRALGEKQKQEVLAGIDARQRAERDWVTGAQSAFNQYVDDATNAAMQAKNAFQSAFKSLEDALYNFFKTGKFAMGDFLTSLKDQLARFAAQQVSMNIIGSIGSALGFGGAAGAGGAAGTAGGMGGMFNMASMANTVSGWMGGPSIGPNILSMFTGGGAGAAGAVGGVGGGAASLAGFEAAGAAFGAGAAGAGMAGAAGVGAAGAATAAGGAVAGGAAAGIGAGAAAGLAAVPVVGWVALAAIAAMYLMGEGGGPKPSKVWLEGSKEGGFGIGVNDVQGGEDMAAILAVNKLLNDKTKYDPDTLSSMIGTSFTAEGPTDTATLLSKMSDSLKGAATAAEELNRVEEKKKADEIANAAAKRSIEIRIMELSGDATGALAARRQDEIKATHESLRALQGHIYSLEDLAVAAAKAREEEEKQKVIADARRQIEIRIMEMSGDAAGALAARRADELATIDESNRALQGHIYSLEDLAVAQQKAAEAAQAAAKEQEKAAREAATVERELAGDRVSAVSAAIAKLRESYTREAALISEGQTKWRQASEDLRAYADTLMGSRMGSMTYSAAAANFNEVVAGARSGNLRDALEVSDAGEIFRGASLARSSTALQYARDVARIRRGALAAADVADEQESAALQQLDALETQVSTLLDINGELVTVNEAMTMLNETVIELRKSMTDQARDTKTTKDIVTAVVNGNASLYTRDTQVPS